MRSLKSKFLVSTLLLTAPGLWAADRPGFTVETGVFNQYVWRGLVFTNGPVLQTSGTVAYKGAHLNVWTNVDLDSVNGRRGKVNELDFDAGYDRAVGERVTLSGGVIRYTFPNTPYSSTAELYAGASLRSFLNPSVRGYFDVDAIRGAYVTFDVSHSVPMPNLLPKTGWSLDFSAGAGWGSAGYNQGYFGKHGSGMVDFHPSIAAPIAINRHIRLTPRVGYASLIDKSLRMSGAAGVHNFFCGISLAYTF